MAETGKKIRKGKCSVCHTKIETMCFRGTGVCSEKCRKKRDGDVPHGAALVSAPIIRTQAPSRISGKGRVPRVQG